MILEPKPITGKKTMNEVIKTFREKLVSQFADLGDPQRAQYQQSYMKTEMLFWGIRTPEVRKIVSTLISEYQIETAEKWDELIEYVWDNASRREEWYAAIEILNHQKFKQWVLPDHIVLIEKMVVEGAWWEIVDPIATHGVNRMLLNKQEETERILLDWAQAGNIWKRRAAILTQLLSKKKMDWNLQQEIMGHSLLEKEFFLQKAIGWVLRQYSRTDPQRVMDYFTQNEGRMSPLAQKEGMKLIRKNKLAK